MTFEGIRILLGRPCHSLSQWLAHHESKHDVLQINKYIREYNTIIAPAAPVPQKCVPCSPCLFFACAHPELLKIPTVLKGFPLIVLDALISIASNAYQKSVVCLNKNSQDQ